MGKMSLDDEDQKKAKFGEAGQGEYLTDAKRKKQHN